MEILKRASDIWSPAALNLGSAFALGFICSTVFPIGEMIWVASHNLSGSLEKFDAITLPEIPYVAIIGAILLLGTCALLVSFLRSENSAKRRLVNKPDSVIAATVPETARVVDIPEASTQTDPSAELSAKESAFAEAYAELEKQLVDLLRFVSRYLESSDAYSASVTQAQSELNSAVSVEQIRAAIKILVVQHEKEQCNARELRDRLEDSQSRTTEINERLVQVETEAKIDALTSVANRRWFEEFLDREVAKSHEEETPLCLLMADLDLFKKINDTFGHQTGDEVIKRFARLLSENVRSTDLVSRYGGEEFAIVLPKTPSGNAFQLAERVRSKLEAVEIKDTATGQHIGQVTASFGIAEIHEEELPSSLIERADRKLYDAKRNGRNRTELESSSSLTREKSTDK